MHADHDIWINIYDERSVSIVKMRLDDVVKRMTARELPEIFNIEAVKALAVVIRTSVVKRLKFFDGTGCYKYKGADICTDMKGCSDILDLGILSKVVGDNFNKIFELASNASDCTSGIIVTCGGRPIAADYHLTCGGGTENSEDVLGNSVMYFRKVLCKYCSNSPHWENTMDISLEELESKLEIKGAKGSSIWGPEIQNIIEDIERDETGRVRKIKIGGRYFSGKEVKDILGLSSSRFGWDPLILRFKVRGSGSGLGMCLYGANAMAEKGHTYHDILKYYYTNIKIEYIDIAGDSSPLKGKMFVIDPGHGGKNGDDETGPTGLREKDVNLYIAKKLIECLEEKGAEVKLTRSEDEDISLPRRIEMINNMRPNFVISIHQNSFFAPGVCGTEVYYYRGDIEGEKMGRMIHDNIVKALGTTSRGNRNADFYILRESKVSAVVVECMYITNPAEECKLKDDAVKDEIGKSIYRGIMDYYGI